MKVYNPKCGSNTNKVFENVGKTFTDYRIIVVWTMETYEVFCHSMQLANNKLPKHKVVVLQDVLNLIAMEPGVKVGFETALRREGMEYDKNCLHTAKNDVKYMYELYVRTYESYKCFSCNEEAVINLNTNVIHDSGCRYAKQAGNKKVADKILVFEGYRLCSCCATEENWRRLYWEKLSNKEKKLCGKRYRKQKRATLKNLSLTDENIKRICENFELEYNITDSIVFIKTKSSYWRVYLEDDKVTDVFHSNYIIPKHEYNKKKKWNEGYHKQPINKTNFYDVVSYISYHDKDAGRKKNRIDILLEQISQSNVQ